MRATTLTADCLGTLPGRCFEPMDMQHMVFQQNDPPPFQSPNWPTTKCITRQTNGKLKRYDGGFVEGGDGTTVNKGLLQVLYERGLYVPGMKLREDSATQRKKIFAELTYETVVRKFRDYVGVAENENVPAEELNDHNFSNFLLKVGKEHEWKPDFRKSSMAAIGAILKRKNLDQLFFTPHLYRETHRVIMHWRCELKINPYHAVGSQAYCAAALAAILQLLRSSPQELRDSAVVILACFTSLRIEDVEGMFPRSMSTWLGSSQADVEGMVTVKSANKTQPHRIIIVLDKTKNNKTGSGPIAGRTFGLPCTCSLDMDVAETAQFAQLCKSNTKHPCPDICPYQVVMDYQNAKPTSLDPSSKGKRVAPGEMLTG
ncbi:hypothetical protein B484DRAFT_398701 [Ochromonadaceae sp. CCMP2298]|nr:hypothetical protein B484DRAFT_398701 [Ochromonadaceae sp. CCMP2298]